MVNLGMITNPIKSITKEINKSKNLGFDYVEIGIEPPTDAFAIRKDKSPIIKSLKNLSNPAIAHTAWWYDLSSSYKGVREAWINQANADISIANELEIKLLNFHFLIPSGILLKNQKARKNVLENYASSLNLLAKIAKNQDITLMLENGVEKFEHYKYVLDRAPQIKVHFDIGHAFISGGMKNIKKFISFGDRVAHIHIHDNHGKQDEHLALR